METEARPVLLNDIHTLAFERYGVLIWDSYPHHMQGGQVPCARRDATMESFVGRVAVFGGYDESDNPLCDLHLYDHDHRSWTLLFRPLPDSHSETRFSLCDPTHTLMIRLLLPP